MSNISSSALRLALAQYEKSADALVNSEERADLDRIVRTAEKLADALDSGNMDEAKLSALAFSRQVSDSYFSQPPTFKALGQEVAKVRRAIAS